MDEPEEEIEPEASPNLNFAVFNQGLKYIIYEYIIYSEERGGTLRWSLFWS